MKFLSIDPLTTFSSLCSIVGRSNISSVLSMNGLKISPDIGKQFSNLCSKIADESTSVSASHKVSILNSMTQDSDIYQTTATLGEAAWKVLSKLGTFPGYLKLPTSIITSGAGSILGNGVSVLKSTIDKVTQAIFSGDPESKIQGIFGKVFTSGVPDKVVGSSNENYGAFEWFRIPWGEITMYSSISGESVDFPVYPEDPQDKRQANYNQMPDMLYQFEPWQLYHSSGPRSNTYKFHMHRDMWTGDHRDGKANDLIRFCESNCYPDYNGSLVNAPTVTLYVAGGNLISGILTDVSKEWSGPIGLDGWYLEFTLSLSITEVSKEALNYKSVRKLPLIG